MIFFDGEHANVDEAPSRRGWWYAATNAGVFMRMVALTIVGIAALLTLMAFGRVIVAWMLVLGYAVWK